MFQRVCPSLLDILTKHNATDVTEEDASPVSTMLLILQILVQEETWHFKTSLTVVLRFVMQQKGDLGSLLAAYRRFYHP